MQPYKKMNFDDMNTTKNSYYLVPYSNSIFLNIEQKNRFKQYFMETRHFQLKFQQSFHPNLFPFQNVILPR